MYEMEGALPGLATPGLPVTRLTWRHAPPAGTRHPCEVPVSRLLSRSEVAPGWFPFPTVNVFLLLSLRSRKSLLQFILNFSLSPRSPQNANGYPHVAAGYPPTYAQLTHRLLNVIQQILI